MFGKAFHHESPFCRWLELGQIVATVPCSLCIIASFRNGLCLDCTLALLLLNHELWEQHEVFGGVRTWIFSECETFPNTSHHPLISVLRKLRKDVLSAPENLLDSLVSLPSTSCRLSIKMQSLLPRFAERVPTDYPPPPRLQFRHASERRRRAGTRCWTS